MSEPALSVVLSPRIAQFIEQLSHDHLDEKVRQFWAEIELEGTPLIEPVPDDHDQCIVTFLWRADDDDLQQVLLLIDTITDQYRRDDLSLFFMEQVEATDIWHISYQMRSDLRAGYHFYPVSAQSEPLSASAKTREEWLHIVTHTAHDRFNPAIFPSKRNEVGLSVLELPQAPDHPWWQSRADVPKGKLDHHRLKSDILGNERDIWVYTPAGYRHDHDPYPVLLLLDGQNWVQVAFIQSTLDNLIAESQIPPMVAIAIDSLDGDTRADELTCNPSFIDFLTDELLVWAGERWTITQDPARTIISGQSYGGLASAYAGFRASNRIGNALCQSGSFWWQDDNPLDDNHEWLTQQFSIVEKLPLRFYVSVGWQEWMLLSCNRHLRDVLTAKGYDLIYSEYNGGHDYVCWRGGIADGLIALTQTWDNLTITAELESFEPIIVTPRSTIPPQRTRSVLPAVVNSPRIEALKVALRQGDSGALQQFWEEVRLSGTPLIESVADHDDCIVTFLYQSADDLQDVVILANKFTDATVFDASVMERLSDTDVWHRSYQMRSDWRASYQLAPLPKSASDRVLGATVARMVERSIAVGSPVSRAKLERWWGAIENAIPDPLNPNLFDHHSVVSLPDAPPQSWLVPDKSILGGQVSEHLVRSDILDDERRVWVYTPANYSADHAPYGVLLMLDGQLWVGDAGLAVTLDNLIAEGKIPPIVAIMPEALGFESRVKQMACHPPFVEFLRDELMVWAVESWNITTEAQQTIIAGQSLGGLTSALAGLIAPERFGNVLSQSGSFWWANGSVFGVHEEWMAQQYAKLSKRAVRFYLEVGMQEWVLVSPTRHLRNVLNAKGYDVTYREFNGGHDRACFRGSVADGLMALTRDW